ncbi:MAG: ATP-dependent Clp protease ATP-binding subunit [Candidatus Saccharimonadales bacterium]
MAVDRALLARAGGRLHKPAVLAALGFTSGGFLLLGVFLAYTGSSWCWFVLGLSVWPLLGIIWIKYGLVDIPPNRTGETITDLLESAVLGRLSRDPSPQDAAKALSGTTGGNFYAARYGITPEVIAQLSSDQPQDMAAVWQAACALQGQLAPGVVTSTVLAAALINNAPSSQVFLPSLSLDANDIVSGAAWQQHLMDVFLEYKKPKKTGGFARDWSFGYTPLLEQFGRNISMQIQHGSLPQTIIASHQTALSQITHLLSSGAHRNAALIGQLGVGKMAIVEAFAHRLLFDSTMPKELRYNQVIALDASSLISNAPGRGQLEQLVNDVLVEAFRAKNVVICLDNAQLFFEEGVGSIDVSNILLPILEGGGLRIVLTMDSHKWLQISQRVPALATSLNRVAVEPPSKEDTIKIMQNQLIFIEHNTKTLYAFQALEAAYDLGNRYVAEQAMPGKAIKLLESAANYAEGGYVTSQSVQQAVEQIAGVKVGTANQQDERDTLLNMEQLIHERMIGQTRAVQVVSDALRRARSGVRNQNRPVGTFLFLGPTGVGKTELSKALASVYFGGEDRLLRVDLNEYVRSEDVARLITDASTNEHSLAAQVSRQPFSVVLLDEIEKAHPDVLTTLLQVLDEGVLRDINGRQVNCRDAIIIATSNAGSQQIRDYIAQGTPLEQVEKQLTNELIETREFKPEFLNRFDEIVVFAPLAKAELRQIVDLILLGLNKNLDNQKITVQVADDAKDLLVEAGYDPQLGARPMRRVVQRCVENVVARRMLEGGALPGQTILLAKEDIAANLER